MKRVCRAFLLSCFPAITWQARADPVEAGQGDAGMPGPASPFFAFCIEHDALKRTMPDQAALLAEIGYEGFGHLWLAGADKRAKMLSEAGLRLYQVYVKVDLAQPKPYDEQMLAKVLPALGPHRTQLALLVKGGKPSDPGLDARAVEVVTRIADTAKPFGVTVVLYPHTSDWLEKPGDAVRIAAKVNRPGEVGAMFNLCHWMKADPNRNLRAVLGEMKPWLMAVSLSGSDTPEEVRAGEGNWIQPLGQGSYDIGEFLGALRSIHYTGPVGLQCYGIRGDARRHLQQSMETWKRLATSPD